jgi:hypothetical protein
MALHDAYARRTPYEFVLPSHEYGEERFPLVAEEAETQGFSGHLTDIRSFSLLGEVGAILREIRTEDDPPEMIQQYGMLIFHAFHFWTRRFPLFLASVDASRRAVDRTELTAFDVPESGCAYLQLPQHLFWVPGPGENPPESLDGIFTTWANGELFSMAVAGVSSRRAGVITMPLPPVHVADLSVIAGETMRENGADFSSSMAGAEIDRLYGVESAGEVVKLAARLLPLLPSAELGEVGSPGSTPAASRFSYRRLK